MHPTDMLPTMLRRFTRILWNTVISVRLTIVLLIVISAVCVIGTVVPQNLEPHQYLQLYAESTYRRLHRLPRHRQQRALPRRAMRGLPRAGQGLQQRHDHEQKEVDR